MQTQLSSIIADVLFLCCKIFVVFSKAILEIFRDLRTVELSLQFVVPNIQVYCYDKSNRCRWRRDDARSTKMRRDEL